MSIEANKALVRRYYAAIDAGDLTAIDQFVAADYIDHNPGMPGLAPGREGLRQFFLLSLNGFAEFKHTLDAQIAEHDLVVNRITASGVHTGDFLGVPATGKHVQMTSITIYRIAGGTIVEHWSERDALGTLQQLGLLPAMQPASA